MPVKIEGLPSKIRDKKRAAVTAWGNHPSLVRLLQDHFPGPRERIQRCRRGNYRTFQSVERPDIFKSVPYVCHQIPFCILCTRADRVRRVKAALDNFHRCTPAGKELRFCRQVRSGLLRLSLGTGVHGLGVSARGRRPKVAD